MHPVSPAEYSCSGGHTFTVNFAEGATPPSNWWCPQHGQDSTLVGDADAEPRVYDARHRATSGVPARIPYIMMMERRTPEQMETALNAALAAIRKQGGGRWGSAVVGDMGYAYPLPE